MEKNVRTIIVFCVYNLGLQQRRRSDYTFGDSPVRSLAAMEYLNSRDWQEVPLHGGECCNDFMNMCFLII